MAKVIFLAASRESWYGNTSQRRYESPSCTNTEVGTAVVLESSKGVEEGGAGGRARGWVGTRRRRAGASESHRT
eukprot:6271424-Prymnesium_polylepis.2